MEKSNAPDARVEATTATHKVLGEYTTTGPYYLDIEARVRMLATCVDNVQTMLEVTREERDYLRRLVTMLVEKKEAHDADV